MPRPASTGTRERLPPPPPAPRPPTRPHPPTIFACASHTLQELLLSYNIGIPAEQREKEMNQRAAARVGLRMPDAIPLDGGGSGGGGSDTK